VKFKALAFPAEPIVLVLVLVIDLLTVFRLLIRMSTSRSHPLATIKIDKDEHKNDWRHSRCSPPCKLTAGQ
jgi:hypothetical protein